MPSGFAEVLHSLDHSELVKQVGDGPIDLGQWLPWIDRVTIGVGVQFQDMMANQVLTLGASVRLPIYNPKDDRANAYILENKAALAEIDTALEAMS